DRHPDGSRGSKENRKNARRNQNKWKKRPRRSFLLKRTEGNQTPQPGKRRTHVSRPHSTRAVRPRARSGGCHRRSDRTAAWRQEGGGRPVLRPLAGAKELLAPRVFLQGAADRQGVPEARGHLLQDGPALLLLLQPGVGAVLGPRRLRLPRQGAVPVPAA